MRGIRNINPVARAMGVIGAVAVLATAVTFAALSDTATLEDNNLTSDTADLQVSNGGAYGDSVAGFSATDVVPGVGKTFSFYLKNGSDFDMNVTASVPGACGDYVDGNDGIPNCGDVLLTFTDTESTDDETYTLQQLINGPKDLPGNPLPANTAGSAPADADEGDFTVKFDLDPDDVTGATASLTNPFDLVFTGTQAL